MKKMKSSLMIASIALFIIAGWLPGSGARADNDPESSTDLEIKRGYKVSKYKHLTGYRLDYYGFFGVEFVKTVKEYDYLPCCRPTHDKMDGCSAPVVCP